MLAPESETRQRSLLAEHLQGAQIPSRHSRHGSSHDVRDCAAPKLNLAMDLVVPVSAARIRAPDVPFQKLS